MNSHTKTAEANRRLPRWLERVNGDGPILIIAPHGGRAGPAARAALHPKVNDLETASISRELAAQLDATALVNSGMDRNELDCNRLPQILGGAPWLLDTIADEVAQIAERRGRVTVLLIHGWNIIEPRVDLGLGLRERNGRLQPPRGAHVSANDEFIRGPAAALAARLRDAGIAPTFGLRYPGGGAQNLLQAFTPRFDGSEHSALARLAQLARDNLIDALQLELSVAVRLVGESRREMMRAIVDIFGRTGCRPSSPAAIEIRRRPPPPPGKRPGRVSAAPPAFRIGVEFYDPGVRIGGIASFDFGPNAAGGRIMMLSERRRVALFTGEGGAVRQGDCVSLGPLALEAGTRLGGLRFNGPAVVVDEGTAYLSVEAALACGRLDPRMTVDTTLEFDHGMPGFGTVLARLEALIESIDPSRAIAIDTEVALLRPSFARLHGIVSFEGVRRQLNAIARVGVSFTGLGPRKFVERRMLWACAPGPLGHHPIELRALTFDDALAHRSAEIFSDGAWRRAELAEIELQTQSPYEPPPAIGAVIIDAVSQIRLEGAPDTFMTLSRPGPDGTRIHTSLGFARFRIGDTDGVGMYEYSRRAGAGNGQPADDDD